MYRKRYAVELTPSTTSTIVDSTITSSAVNTVISLNAMLKRTTNEWVPSGYCISNGTNAYPANISLTSSGVTISAYSNLPYNKYYVEIIYTKK